MALFDDMLAKVTEFATTAWGNIPNARVVPEPPDLTHGNTGERMELCILYADIHRSTEMVDTLPDTVAAEYYKAFLHCAAVLIRRNGGNIQAYDGDRIMAVFTGSDQAKNAVHAAFEIHYAVLTLINPIFAVAKPDVHRIIRHTVGIDTGAVLIAKTGVPIDRDLVWVGPAANYAAKLNSFNGLDIDFPTRITSEVYLKLDDHLKIQGDNLMWNGPYNDLGQRMHFRSNYWLKFT